MKKFFLGLVAAFAAISASAGAGIIRPIEVHWDLNHLPNGEYAVACDVATVKSTAKGTTIEFEIYSENLYDASLVAMLAAGDQIITDSGVVEVKTVKKIDDRYVVNDNMEGCIDFEPKGKGKFRICIEDDHSTYTSQGKVRLLVPASVNLVDNGIDGDPMKTVTVKNSRLAKYMPHNWDPEFFQLNTRITVRNGKIVKFVRHYIP